MDMSDRSALREGRHGAVPASTGRSLSRTILARPALALACAGTAIVLAALFLWRLDQSPPYLHQDEAGFGLASYLFATTGRDYFGNLLPVYVGYFENHQLGGSMISFWAIPFVKAMGLSVVSLRASMALAGMVSLGLFALLGWRLTRSRWASLAGVWILATSPLFFMQSRVFLELLLPVPFVIGWLICTVEFDRRRDERFLLFSAVILGLGFYSYGTARMIMPIYLVLTLAAYHIKGACSWRTVGGALAIYCALMLPAAAFTVQDPSLYLARFRGLSWWSAELQPYAIATTFVRQYLGSFDPLDLFARGDSSFVHSTGRAGVYMLAGLPLAIVGVWRLLVSSWRERSALSMVLLLAFLLFPAPLALLQETHAPGRALYAVPEYAILCVVGLRVFAVRSLKSRVVRVALAALMVAYAVQVVAFMGDYFGGYPARAVAAGDFNGNKPAAFRTLLEGNTGERVFYDIEDVTSMTYARFFQAEYGFRGEFLPGPPASPATASPGVRALTLRPERYRGGFEVVARVPEIVPSIPGYTVLEKRGAP